MKKIFDILLFIIFIGISLIALIYLPKFFISYDIFNIFNNKSINNPGSEIGGVTAPIVGFIIAIVTYLAFYTQVRANRKVTNDLKIGRIESKFYQMLELHRENVSNFKFISAKNDGTNKNEIKTILKGRDAFEMLLSTVNKYYIESFGERPRKKLTIAYSNIFHGNEKIEFKCKRHSIEIAHYIRQLYQTVKFIANNKYLSKKEKHNYLRILRAQMSTDEQILLFYNWYAKYGTQWENKKNHFLLEYRMIHNIFPDRIPLEIMNVLRRYQNIYKRKKNSQKDSIFEYQDW
jgi:hypothetical protein